MPATADDVPPALRAAHHESLRPEALELLLCPVGAGHARDSSTSGGTVGGMAPSCIWHPVAILWAILGVGIT